LAVLAIPLAWIVWDRIQAIRVNLKVPKDDLRSYYDGFFWRRLY
jgi:hypothetical protein